MTANSGVTQHWLSEYLYKKPVHPLILQPTSPHAPSSAVCRHAQRCMASHTVFNLQAVDLFLSSYFMHSNVVCDKCGGSLTFCCFAPQVLFAKPFPEFSCKMNAWATALTCQWLMGPCKVNDVEVDGGKVGAGSLKDWSRAAHHKRCCTKWFGISKC